MAVVPLRLGEPVPDSAQSGFIAVGNFDGVHVGHTALIAAARAAAHACPVVAVTFDPHPLAVLAPEKYQPPLTTLGDRTHLLEECGCAHVVVLHTSRELLQLTPEEFFATIVRAGFKARGMVEGFNFRFGRDRAGSNETLRELCATHDMRFVEVPPHEVDGRPVSSSRVRAALLAGDLLAAERLMRRRFRIHGTVGVGARRGRQIGFPTANVHDVATLLPLDGVYAAVAITPAGRFAAAVNIGPNPTFGESQRKIEAHLLDFAGDLYNQPLGIEFVERLRGTTAFASVDDLVKQLSADVECTRRIGDPLKNPL